MSYTRVNWQNSPSTSTPLSAENLNQMDAGIKQNADDIEQLQQHTYDAELNGSSTNAPQTKAVYEAIQEIDIETDTTLSVSGKAADAAATGEAIANVKSAIEEGLYAPKTVSGSAIDVNDAFGGLAKNVVLSDPTATVYVSGNMFPTAVEDTKSGNDVTAVSDGKGKFSVSGTASAQNTLLFTLSESVTISYGMIFHFHNSAGISGTSMSFYEPNGTAISGASIALNTANKVVAVPSTHKLIGKTVGKIGLYCTSGTAFNMTLEPMILWVSSVMDFMPYHKELSYSAGTGMTLYKGYNHIRTSVGTVAFTYSAAQVYITDAEAQNKVDKLFSQTVDFESGKYNDASGEKQASASRIRNTNLIDLEYVKHITLPSPYSAQVHFYNSAGTWLGYCVDWKSYFDASQVSSNTKYIGLTIRNDNTPNADISSQTGTVKNGIKTEAVLEGHRIVSDIYTDVVENLKQTRRTKNTSKDNYLTRNKPLTLFHFSDIHQEQGNLRDIVNFAAENSDLIDDTICTGDIVGARFQNGMAWFDGVPGAENILLAIGNHDVMNAASGYDDSQTATLAQIYTQFIAPYYANWNLSSDPSSGVTYYYKDYPDSKVRLIVLDCMLDSVDASADATQYTWFVATLADAITNGYYVVVANHCFPSGASFVASNWTNADYQNPQTYLDSRYPGAVDDFIGNGGHFVCWLEGHSHADYYMNYVGTHGTQMALSVDAASRYNAEGFTDVNRLEQDRSYNSANLVTVDTGAEVIKVVKFGALSNYKLIPRKTLTLGFDGSIIVQE